jgi:hypothetical protein
MAATRLHHYIFFFLIVAFTSILIATAHDDDDENTKAVDTGDQPQLAEEELDYHKGSLCGYCTYCKVRFDHNLYLDSILAVQIR